MRLAEVIVLVSDIDLAKEKSNYSKLNLNMWEMSFFLWGLVMEFIQLRACMQVWLHMMMPTLKLD